MKILFITSVIKDLSSGVFKKNGWQVKAMRALGHQVSFGYFDTQDTFVIENEHGQVTTVIPAHSYGFGRRKVMISIKNFMAGKGYELLYSRWEQYYPLIARTYREIKKTGTKVYLEIPTYPLQEERKNIRQRYFKEKRYVKWLKHWLYQVISEIGEGRMKDAVDKVVTFMNHKTIWGIPVICLDNGVDVESVPHRTYVPQSSIIHLIGVGNIADWHGYDRLIRSIKDYYSLEKRDYDVKFTIVGDGISVTSLKRLVTQLNLEQIVQFTGLKHGKELDQLFDHADVAVSSLAEFRRNLETASTLKMKEYVARGIPIIYAYNEMGLTGNEFFVKQFPNNDSAIDFSEIIQFVLECRENHQKILEIREFAVKKYDWKLQIQHVFELKTPDF
ncbi:glycosyltransferase family 4 protein [Paenibacillus solisilvae]|uniref:Glycosyltransferase family 4 protein n=1 Tax=Paenibacillus solisilvae TaxID=2486751 RepID=A0ABW0VXF2_9BACL